MSNTNNIKVRLEPENTIKVRLGPENALKVIPSIGAATLAALNDVDISNLEGGYILIYDADTKKWKATNILTPGEEQNLIVNGGNF